MTDEMKPYIEQLNSKPITHDPLNDDTMTDLNEGILRGLSAIALINKIRKLNSQIKTSKSVDQKINLLGEQNYNSSLLTFAMTQFTAGKK